MIENVVKHVEGPSFCGVLNFKYFCFCSHRPKIVEKIIGVWFRLVVFYGEESHKQCCPYYYLLLLIMFN